MLATDMTSAGTAEEKLAWAFKVKLIQYILVEIYNRFHERDQNSTDWNVPCFYLQMYDKDDSGTIELSEMTDIIGTLYDMEGVTSSGGEGNISKP